MNFIELRDTIEVPEFDAHLVLCDPGLFPDLMMSVVPGYTCGGQVGCWRRAMACQISGRSRPRSGTGSLTARAQVRNLGGARFRCRGCLIERGDIDLGW